MHRVDKVYVAVLLCEEECLIEVLLESLEVNVQVLWHDHMLTVSEVRLASLVEHLGTLLREVDLEVIPETLD